MRRATLSLPLALALFFGSLLSARFIDAAWWTWTLFPLAFSLGWIALITTQGLTTLLIAEAPRRMVIITLVTVIALLLCHWLLAPVKAPPPDPFLPDRPPPFDWRSIFAHMLPLPLALGAGFHGAGLLLAALRGTDFHFAYLVSGAAAVTCTLLAVNRVTGRLPLLVLLGINLLVALALVLANHLVVPPDRAGDV